MQTKPKRIAPNATTDTIKHFSSVKKKIVADEVILESPKKPEEKSSFFKMLSNFFTGSSTTEAKEEVKKPLLHMIDKLVDLHSCAEQEQNTSLTSLESLTTEPQP